MKDLAAIQAASAEMTIDELEKEMHARDAEVHRVRAEMGVIHKILEPKWDALMRANAGPAHLAQGLNVSGMGVGKRLEDLPADELRALANRIVDALNKKGGE